MAWAEARMALCVITVEDQGTRPTRRRVRHGTPHKVLTSKGGSPGNHETAPTVVWCKSIPGKDELVGSRRTRDDAPVASAWRGTTCRAGWPMPPAIRARKERRGPIPRWRSKSMGGTGGIHLGVLLAEIERIPPSPPVPPAPTYARHKRGETTGADDDQRGGEQGRASTSPRATAIYQHAEELRLLVNARDDRMRGGSDPAMTVCVPSARVCGSGAPEISP